MVCLRLLKLQGMLARVARDRDSAVVSVSQSLCLASLSISKLHKVYSYQRVESMPIFHQNRKPKIEKIFTHHERL